MRGRFKAGAEPVATARLRYLRGSAQKARLVVDQLRGRSVEDALGTLKHSPKRVARDLEKLVQSAVSNAQQKDPNLDVDNLYVSKACVDEAPPFKRSRHVAMGRVFRVLKRNCHVSINLAAARRGA